MRDQKGDGEEGWKERMEGRRWDGLTYPCVFSVTVIQEKKKKKGGKKGKRKKRRINRKEKEEDQ